ncbi:uncharacterized protein LOC125178540 [Hyalella azteca]|uniref:Uncharacterized protein LOC125178540 n=1 Tax=Hyalella azteca TaxID=294128 RepID=A0A979FQS3_HYAAZ|nr:uncharacterized protein LOC125178540 [Hyalella azteca]
MYPDFPKIRNLVAVFLVPRALHIWLLIDSQTGYAQSCTDVIQRTKKLIIKSNRDGHSTQKIWHLRGIQNELERMPRFTIFGLFELGRHCLLSMLSLLLTYVIIVAQFVMSSNPVTCSNVQHLYSSKDREPVSHV